MSAPVPRRRPRGYDSRVAWRKVHVYVPAALAARLDDATGAEGKTKKDLVIDALEKRLPPSRAQSTDESDDD